MDAFRQRRAAAPLRQPNVQFVWDNGQEVRVIYNEPYEIHSGRFVFMAWRHGLYPSEYPNYILNLADPVEWELWTEACAIYRRNETLVLRAMTKARIERGFDAPANERAGFVYILRASGIQKLGAEPTGIYKIGRTNDLNNRLETFSVKLPFEVDYEWVIPTADRFVLEGQLHELFADKHFRGEWYALTVDDLQLICKRYPYEYIDGDAFDSFPGA